MSDDQPSLRDLFEIARELSSPQRDMFLAEKCGDADLRARVTRMLAWAETGVVALPTASAEDLARKIEESAETFSFVPGGRIGPFELKEIIGEGGSSTVFRAERVVDGVHQKVALKLLRRGVHSPDAQRQFRRERMALTQLEHPGIARLIEGGVSVTGLAYIALDLIDGMPITAYAAKHSLDVEQRLRLFLQVCRAVEAAHRALIVHRDLKPSNVLVTTDGHVKLLDFGIAKILDAHAEDETQTRLPPFTPAYAAPEQRAGGLITTATDVYALGLLLGELLTGTRLNERASRLSNAVTDTATDPGYSPSTKHLQRRLRGDIDNIVAKAMDDEPARRYVSAGALAEDIERHLSARPVRAHPPSRIYRVRKFVRRHRGGVTLAGLFALGVFSALALALWQSSVAREQAQLAHSEAQRANATRDFMVDLLKTANADLPKDQRPTPQQLVDEAAKRAREDPDLDATVRAQLLLTLGEIARDGGDYAHAETLIDEAIERERALKIPISSHEWIDTIVEKGSLLHQSNRNEEADRLMTNLMPELLTADSDAAVSGLMLYSATRLYIGDHDTAVSAAQQALTKAQRVFGPDSSASLATQTYVGQLCSNLRYYRKAEQILEDAVARWRAQKLPENEEFARTLFYLAITKEHLGQNAAVEPLYREGIALMRRVFDGPHDRIAMGLNGLGNFLVTQDRFDDAQTALDEALATDRQVLGAENSKTAVTLHSVAVLDHARHQDALAEKSDRDALAVLDAHAQQAGYEPELAMTRLHLADILVDEKSLDEAASLQAQAASRLPEFFGAASEQVADGLRVGGRVALARNDSRAALDASDRALSMLATLDPPSPHEEIECRLLRARALAASARPDDALAEITRAIELLKTTNPDAHAQRIALLAQRARIEQSIGKNDKAASTIVEARALSVQASVLSADDAKTIRPNGE